MSGNQAMASIERLEQVALSELAQTYGTPCYVYSKAKIEANFRAYQSGFASRAHLICYSVKANSNLSVLQVLADLGAGFDIVSGGELARVLAIGVTGSRIVFSGVGKTSDEICAALKVGILSFNIESMAELERIEKIAAKANQIAPISVRINPDIDAKTHPYISTGLKENKFGIDMQSAFAAYQYIAQSAYLQAVGVDFHIGSQLTDLAPFADAVDKALGLVDALGELGMELHHLDFGGGLGINYQNDQPPSQAALVAQLMAATANRKETIIIEPGRSLVGDAGIFLTSIEHLKSNGDKHFCIVDGAMNDLLRPSLYGAWQAIVVVTDGQSAHKPRVQKIYDVVGPVCETGDFLGKDRPLAVGAGDVLAVLDAGAYGFSMSSNYNTRARAAEVLVDGSVHRLIRAREQIPDLFASEKKWLLREST